MGTLLTFLAVGLVTLIAAGVVISVLGAVLGLTFGLAQFLLFKVAPIMDASSKSRAVYRAVSLAE